MTATGRFAKLCKVRFLRIAVVGEPRSEGRLSADSVEKLRAAAAETGPLIRG